jgi:SAM-dependent methyltransferase
MSVAAGSIGGMAELAAAIAAYWDAAAPGFDAQPDHGLGDERTRAAWSGLLREWAPPEPSDVLDVGCGTGSLSLLLAAAGHRVTGVDLAPRMVRLAQAKLAEAGYTARFLVGDATVPPTDAARFDMVVCRHVIWTLPDPAAALREWTARLRTDGRLVLIEGRWSIHGDGFPYAPGTESLPWNGGVAAADLMEALKPFARALRTEPLTDAALWGHPIHDERYAIIARV